MNVRKVQVSGVSLNLKDINYDNNNLVQITETRSQITSEYFLHL